MIPISFGPWGRLPFGGVHKIASWWRLSRLRWWFRRTVIYPIRWWLCNFTGGHEWSAILSYDFPRTGDWTQFGATTICRRCTLSLHSRGAVSQLMQSTAHLDVLKYQKERVARELLAATAGRAVPVIEDVVEWANTYGAYWRKRR